MAIGAASGVVYSAFTVSLAYLASTAPPKSMTPSGGMPKIEKKT